MKKKNIILIIFSFFAFSFCSQDSSIKFQDKTYSKSEIDIFRSLYKSKKEFLDDFLISEYNEHSEYFSERELISNFQIYKKKLIIKSWFEDSLFKEISNIDDDFVKTFIYQDTLNQYSFQFEQEKRKMYFQLNHNKKESIMNADLLLKNEYYPKKEKFSFIKKELIQFERVKLIDAFLKKFAVDSDSVQIVKFIEKNSDKLVNNWIINDVVLVKSETKEYTDKWLKDNYYKLIIPLDMNSEYSFFVRNLKKNIIYESILDKIEDQKKYYSKEDSLKFIWIEKKRLIENGLKSEINIPSFEIIHSLEEDSLVQNLKIYAKFMKYDKTNIYNCDDIWSEGVDTLISVKRLNLNINNLDDIKDIILCKKFSDTIVSYKINEDLLNFINERRKKIYKKNLESAFHEKRNILLNKIRQLTDIQIFDEELK